MPPLSPHVCIKKLQKSYLRSNTVLLQHLTVFVVDVGPHMHLCGDLVAEALRRAILGKVQLLNSDAK